MYFQAKKSGGVLFVFISDILYICDPVLAFDRIMEEIETAKYLKPEPFSRLGRPGYNRVSMLKTVLFGFMDTGYASLRKDKKEEAVNPGTIFSPIFSQPLFYSGSSKNLPGYKEKTFPFSVRPA